MILACRSRIPGDLQGIDPVLIQTGEYRFCHACFGYVHGLSWQLHMAVVHGLSEQPSGNPEVQA